MDYGGRLKNLRLSKGISQQELADRLQINRSTYARYELSKTQPDFATLEKLADFYGVTTDYIIKGIKNSDVDLTEDEKEMLEFFKNPELNLFFKEMAQSEEGKLEQLRKIWEAIKDDIK
ncbi:helix-turn-helix transcriptional regulator [Domibacillus aminovorans]|uniref:helix-turn-helix domain-containing protein n=1 Tax=Domibacillus aminovorans TaxID=29332 RepID=UPI003D24E3DE